MSEVEPKVADYDFVADWQLMKTAPHDQIFLGFWLGHVRMVAWNLEVGAWQEYPDGDFPCGEDELTHWMPLPEPPR